MTASVQRIVRNRNFVGLVLALIALVVYVRTLAPTVTFIDSGELAAVATTLGIAHPTGYPLFTLIGWLFAHFPLGFRTIYQLNLLSAVLCSISIFFYYKSFLFLLSDDARLLIGKLRNKARAPLLEDKHDPNEPIRNSIAAASGALVLAFSETFWSQALSIEVYSLHLFFLSLTLLLFLKALREGIKSSRPLEEKFALWYGFAFVVGLSFTNHMTTILLAPGFLYLFFAAHGASSLAWRKILRAVIPFLIGLSVYLYLPLRAVQEPLLNWGNPTTLEKFWWHFTGRQYRVWIFSSFESAEKQLHYFFQHLPSEFAYVPLIFAAMGIWHLFRRHRRMFYFSLILFVSCVFYSINYDIHDIDSYFLLAYVVVSLWVAFGTKVLLAYSERIGKTKLAAITCIAIAVMPLYLHYNAVDESENYTVEDYTKNMFESLDHNALVLSYQWDYFISASYYYQLVEGVRNDVVIIDKELLRRSWYLKQLEYRYPWLIRNSKEEVDAFLKELDKFEHGLPYNSLVIQARFEEMIHSFLAKSYASRPLYVTGEIEPEFIREFQKVPSGLAFRLYRDTAFHAINAKEFHFRVLKEHNTYSDMVMSLYASSYTNQGVYLAISGERKRGLEFLAKAIQIKPDFREALAWLQRLGGNGKD